MVWTVLCVHFYFVQEFPCLKWIFFSQSGVAKPTYDPSMWLWLIKNFGYILNSHTSMEKQGKPFSYALGNAVILNFSCQNQNWKNTHSLTTYQIKIAPVSNECWRSMSEQTHSYALELSQFHFLRGVVLLHLWNENLAAMCVIWKSSLVHLLALPHPPTHSIKK